MKSVLNWIKSNVITVIAILVAIASIVVLVWVQGQDAKLRDQAAANGKDLRDLRGYSRQNIEVPPLRANLTPDQVSGVTINQSTIDAYQAIVENIDAEGDRIRQAVIDHNRANHTVLLEGLFPETTNATILLNARRAYVDAFPDMLRPHSADAQGPRLDAGMPPDQLAIDAAMATLEENLAGVDMPINTLGGGRDLGRDAGASRVSEELQAELIEEKRKQLVGLLNNRARSIHLYAATDVPITSGDSPFQVGEWALSQATPSPQQLWEGQLELWIQQDLARAIATANRVGKPGTSVVEAPVKRLIRMEVIPGYVGQHTAGGMGIGAETRGSRRVGGTRGQRGVGAGDSNMYGLPETGVINNLNAPPSDNFSVSHTGRTSNGIYDVRHARLTLIVDYQKLPLLYEAINRINLMTVLDTQITQVDEYEALQEGFVYGSGDAVEATILVETLWLRGWTEALMPPAVKEYVGVTSDGSSN